MGVPICYRPMYIHIFISTIYLYIHHIFIYYIYLYIYYICLYRSEEAREGMTLRPRSWSKTS